MPTLITDFLNSCKQYPLTTTWLKTSKYRARLPVCVHFLFPLATALEKVITVSYKGHSIFNLKEIGSFMLCLTLLIDSYCWWKLTPVSLVDSLQSHLKPRKSIRQHGTAFNSSNKARGSKSGQGCNSKETCPPKILNGSSSIKLRSISPFVSNELRK